ncbi:putative porin [Undibacterium sp.]|uniref:putative porin n=1 Tax=Undibacterium sp. TaxID=1914977 RepID=UPI002600BA4C|nr:putative porin [Undibacterium sp.]
MLMTQLFDAATARKTQFKLIHKNSLLVLLTTTLFSLSSGAKADEHADLEQLRATTMSLIDALVDSGVLSRQRADKLIRDAEAKAKIKVAEANATDKIVLAPVPVVGADGKKVVRVAYVSEAVKSDMREQIKQEVLLQSKTERWGEPGALPEWMNRVKISGDVRARFESTRLDENNTPPGLAYTDGLYTRAADIVGNTLTGGKSTFNTQHDRSRMRLRARLGIDAQISEMVSTGITLTTGNTTDRTSTNQTLGQNFNKYSVVVDRAFVKLDPAPWLTASAGRIANPFFSTDLVWADDLNFEGVAMTLKPKVSEQLDTFFTAGWFPLRENSPGKAPGRELIGLQGGLAWTINAQTKMKLAAGLYQFRNVEATGETDESHATNSEYLVRYEYPEGFRQRGNTLFYINSKDDPNLNWGLASKFKEFNLTASIDFAQFSPLHVTVTGDYVKNRGFSRQDIFTRTGTAIDDGKDTGYQGKIQFGHPSMNARGNWNVSLAYRNLGSDAVLDAFTNSDFGLGGTNNKGVSLGASYAIDKNTWLSAKWMSSDVIDSMVPRTPASSFPKTKLAVDIFQFELNARF